MFRIFGVAAALALFAMTGSSAAADSGVIGLWHLDEGGGTVAHDSSGNNLTGNLIPVNAPPQWVPGRFGTALGFDGSNGVDVPDNGHSILDSSTSAISVAAWVESNGSPGDYKYIIAKGASGCDAASYGLYTGPTGGLSFYISNKNTSATTDYDLSPDAGGGVWDDTWHLVVGTFDGDTLRLYVDGVQVGAGTSFPGPIDYVRSDSQDLFLGDYYSAPSGCKAGGFTGTIDEPTVWSFALSAAQVSDLYAPPPPSGSSPPSSAPPTPTRPSPTTGTGNGTNHGKAPALSHLRVSPSTLTMIVSGRRTRTMPARGMTISYSDTQAAVSSFSVQLPESGVVQRGRCVAPPKRKIAKHVKRCTRYRVLGRFAHGDRAGTNRFAFTAVRVLQLAPHGYRLVATPSAHRQTGKTVSAKFTIKR